MNKKRVANIALSAVCLGCAVSVSAKNDAKSAKSAAAPVEEVAVVAQEEIEYYPATSADIRLDGEWNIDNVNGQKVTGEERPFITFDLSHRHDVDTEILCQRSVRTSHQYYSRPGALVQDFALRPRILSRPVQ